MYARELGAPTVTTKFRRAGVPSHQTRLILFDVVVRTFVTVPQIEAYRDGSVRYFCSPRTREVHAQLRKDPNLWGYTQDSGEWLMLLSPICVNCLCAFVEHANGKCLFEPTKWQELLITKNKKNMINEHGLIKVEIEDDV
jgi:hypothetical protein